MQGMVYLVGIGILLTGLAVLLLFGSDGPILGIEPDQLARLTQLGAIGILIAVALVEPWRGLRPRLWHAAVWIGLLAALVAAYQFFQAG
jgi:predicted aspartyl protease